MCCAVMSIGTEPQTVEEDFDQAHDECDLG